jgi:putative nucleotidyltransferase with HDIG domain
VNHTTRIRTAPLLAVDPSKDVDWEMLRGTYAEIAAMTGAEQDASHHREGPVDIHVAMVVDRLQSSAVFQSMPEYERHVLLTAAILHDIGKPNTMTVEDGRIHHYGHSRVGASISRRMLFECDADPAFREKVCALIAVHQVPFWLVEKDELASRLFLAKESQKLPLRLLLELARADAHGRICEDQDALIERTELFGVAAEDEGCLETAFEFPDDETRVAAYRRDSIVDPRFSIGTPQYRGEMTVMCGLPGSGKSTVAKSLDASIVSLDDVREELGVDPTDNQGIVGQAAKEKARVFMRACEPFVWDGTNLTADQRGMILTLAHDYGYRMSIHVTDGRRSDLEAAMAKRGRVVPPQVMAGMAGKMRPPEPVDAHTVTTALYAVGGQEPDSAPIP